MKNVFYKRLIADRYGLSANECIVYSFLVYKSICDHEFAWNQHDGAFESSEIENYGEYIDLPFCALENGKLACTPIAKILGIDKSTISRIFKKFKLYGIIDSKEQYVLHRGIFKDGYFELNCENLKGELSIFYHWLKDLKGDKKFIYANRKKLAEMYHVELSDIRWYLHKLKALGCVERQKDGKLLIK